MTKNMLLINIFFVFIFTAFTNTEHKKTDIIKAIEPLTLKVNNSSVTVKSVSGIIKKNCIDKNYIEIKVVLTNNDLAYIDIFLNDVVETAIIDISKDYRCAFSYIDSDVWNLYEASNNYPGVTGKISIKKNDLVAKRIEAEFGGTAVNVSNLEDKKIMKGCFDICY